MARSKSTSGGKANRTNMTKEQTFNSNPANIHDVKASAEETSSTEIKPGIKPESRKLEMVKTEPRKNVVVPINRVPSNIEDEIRLRAYELYLQRGPASGSEAEDWLTAEREVRQRYHQQSA